MMSVSLLLSGLLGCAWDESAGLYGFDATTSEDQVNALDVSWEQDPPGVSRLHVVQGGRTWTSDWSGAGWEHSQRVAGLRADEDVELQVETLESLFGDVHLARTEPLPSWVPELRVSGRASQGLAVPVLDSSGESVALYLDSEGQIVGYGGRGLPQLTALESTGAGTLAGIGDGHMVRVDEQLCLQIESVPGAHHDLGVAPDGRVAWLSLGTEAGVDREWVMIRDQDGDRLMFDRSEHYQELGLFHQEGDGDVQTSHFNSVSWDPWREAWLVSWGSPTGMMWLDDAGNILDVQDFRGEVGHGIEAPAYVELTHEVTPTPTGVMVMANVVEGQDCSQVLELQFQGDVLHQIDQYEGDCQQIFAIGGVRSLGHTETVVTWSTAGLLEVLDGPDRVMEVRLPFGYGFGYASPLEEPFQGR